MFWIADLVWCFDGDWFGLVVVIWLSDLGCLIASGAAMGARRDFGFLVGFRAVWLLFSVVGLVGCFRGFGTLYCVVFVCLLLDCRLLAVVVYVCCWFVVWFIVCWLRFVCLLCW